MMAKRTILAGLAVALVLAPCWASDNSKSNVDPNTLIEQKPPWNTGPCHDPKTGLPLPEHGSDANRDHSSVSDAKRVHAADIDHWSLCMGGGGPAAAVKECTAIIDSGQELPDSLPYAYVYRGKAQFALNQNDSAFQDFTAALKFDPPLDGVVLVVPACCGWRSTGAARDDPNYANNKIFFDQIIERVRYPTVSVFFLGDEYEPADRGAAATATLTTHGVPNLIIDHPPGFSGHGSAWFPAFDYEYGACIADFLEAPQTSQCPQRPIPLRDDDWRAILVRAQLACRQTKTAALPDLSGKQFAVYPDGDLRKVVSADKTEVKGYGIGESLLTSAFRGDLYCVRARVKYNQPETTDEVCSRLVEWSDHELLAVDPQTGNVLQWWIEHRQ
jgi:hypothetical protein